MIDDFDIN